MQIKSEKKFGKQVLGDFFLEDGYVSLNHGSYGTYPKVIRPVLHDLQLKAEVNPDRWLRRDMFAEMDKNKQAVSALLHCSPDELVFVTNAMTGINTVLRSIPLSPGDKIICFNTAYNSVTGTLEFVKNYDKIDLVMIDLAYPMGDDEIISKVEETIEMHNKEGKVKACVLDAISSVPAVRFPFERMVPLLRENNILSVVDGAHAIGQIPLNLHELDCDFFITNCHKWLFTPRGAALLYVPFKNQRFVHPAVINSCYADHSDPSDKSTTFQKEFEWPGTSDFSNFMCITTALGYRESLGGEEAIMNYCHDLAVKGGQVAADILGTSIMENSAGSLTVAMVNVELPLKNPTLSQDGVIQAFIDKLIFEHQCMAPVYPHNGKWYTRLSAQVYNDLDDFKVVANALKTVCQELETK